MHEIRIVHLDNKSSGCDSYSLDFMEFIMHDHHVFILRHLQV